MKKFGFIIPMIALMAACTTQSYLTGGESKKYASSFVLPTDTANVLRLTAENRTASAALAQASLSNDRAIQEATLLALFSVSDKSCETYMSGMITTSNSVSSGLSITSLALSSAASLTSPTRSANLLSGISTFAGGTEKQLSDTVLSGKSPSLLYRAVMGVRKKERSRILKLFEDGTFGKAAIEMEYYHSQCGPTIGINALEEAVDDAIKDAPEKGNEEAEAAL